MKSRVYFRANRVQIVAIKRSMPHWIAAICCVSLISCAAIGSKSTPAGPEKPAPASPELIGRIASTPADRRFVLVQSYGKPKLEAGQILTTRGPEQRTANLLITGESLGEFSAADVQAGAVEVGDAVYLMRKIPQSALNPAPELIKTP